MKSPTDDDDDTPAPKLIHLTDDDDGTQYTLRRPGRPQVDRFLQAVSDGKTSKLAAGERLVFDCLESPDKATVKARFAERSGLPMALIDELLRDAGVSARFTRPPA